ncbi:MAG: translation elongation factor Ts [Acidimicrobiales bacterium]
MDQSYTATDVQRLRQLTGAGMLDCKRALEEAAGDVEAAGKLLRERGQAAAGRRAGRENAQGAVAMVVDGPGALVELRCETDFVAKSPDFVGLVQDLASLVATKGEEAVAERRADVDALTVALGEDVALGRVVRFEASEETLVDGYLHVQNDRGVNGVLVELVGGSHALAHEVAVHIAFARPTYLRREDVPAAEVAAERATLETISRNEGKPEAAMTKIVEGRLNGWFKGRCLLEQAFVRDEKQTIADLLGPARVARFAQVVVGG